MDDAKIIDLFFERSEQAITEIEAKYRRYCHAIALRITEQEQEAETVLNDTWLKVWNTVPPASPSSLKAYVGMISRRLAINAREAHHAQKRGGALADTLNELSECLPDRSVDLSADVALRDLLDRFLKSLPRRTRRVFLLRYWYATPLPQVALASRMSEGAVVALLYRTRKKLKHFLEQEGITV